MLERCIIAWFICWMQEKTTVLMAKPEYESAGSSAHFHTGWEREGFQMHRACSVNGQAATSALNGSDALQRALASNASPLKMRTGVTAQMKQSNISSSANCSAADRRGLASVGSLTGTSGRKSQDRGFKLSWQRNKDNQSGNCWNY